MSGYSDLRRKLLGEGDASTGYLPPIDAGRIYGADGRDSDGLDRNGYSTAGYDAFGVHRRKLAGALSPLPWLVFNPLAPIRRLIWAWVAASVLTLVVFGVLLSFWTVEQVRSIPPPGLDLGTARVVLHPITARCLASQLLDPPNCPQAGLYSNSGGTDVRWSATGDMLADITGGWDPDQGIYQVTGPLRLQVDYNVERSPVSPISHVRERPGACGGRT